MNIIAIDPGTNESGVVRYDEAEHRVTSSKVVPNDVLIDNVRFGLDYLTAHVVIEMVAPMGMTLGRSTRDTILLIGRIQEVCHLRAIPCEAVTRAEVKLHLCNSMRARDVNVRSAVASKFDGTGGGADPVKGTKAKPGPLYGVSSHCWQALALAITWCETNRERVMKAEMYDGWKNLGHFISKQWSDGFGSASTLGGAWYWSYKHMDGCVDSGYLPPGSRREARQAIERAHSNRARREG